MKLSFFFLLRCESSSGNELLEHVPERSLFQKRRPHSSDDGLVQAITERNQFQRGKTHNSDDVVDEFGLRRRVGRSRPRTKPAGRRRVIELLR